MSNPAEYNHLPKKLGKEEMAAMRDLVQVKKDKLETTFFTEEEALKELLHSPDKYMYNPAIRDQGRCGCYLRRLHTQVHD